MRRKAPKKIGNFGTSGQALVDPTDVLVCARVLKALPEDRLVHASFQFFKYAFLEEGRLLAYSAGQEYVLVANLLDESSAGRVRENLAQNQVADLKLCETPVDAAKRVQPWGQVVPNYLSHEVSARMAEDPDIAMSLLQMQAERMDRDPDGDYIFPNLSDDLYDAVKADQSKKSQ